MRRKFTLITCLMLILISIPAAKWGYTRYCHYREQDYRRRCKATYATKNWQELEAIARDWTQWNDQSANAWLYLADAAQQQGDLVQTVERLNRVPCTDPKAVPALIEASHLQFSIVNQPLEGVNTCREILEINPRVPEAHRRLISFYAMTLQRLKLIDQIRESIQLQCEPPEAYVYLILSDHLGFTNGFELNTRWLQSDPQSELFLTARAVQMSDNLDKMVSKHQESDESRRSREQIMHDYLEQFPKNPALLRYFLRKHALAAEVDAVGKLLSRAPAEAAEDSVFWRYRGWYHAAFGELEAADRCYKRAAELFALDWHVWHEWAAVLRRQGKLQQAKQFQQVGVEGEQLRKQLMQIPDAAAVRPQLLARIARYAEACGDELVAQALARRLNRMQQ